MTKPLAEPAQTSAPPAVPPMGHRQEQKAATRGRVLAAARELFETKGYHGATIREIANRAGVSVGSVFTTFSSKGDILSQVMEGRLTGLYGELETMMGRLRGSTADRLRSVFAIYFAFEMKHQRLFMTHIAAAYDWTLPPNARPFGRNQHLLDQLNQCLLDGIRRGDVDPACDTRIVVDLLIAAYGWTYRWALSENATPDMLAEIMDGQIAVIAAGFTPRP